MNFTLILLQILQNLKKKIQFEWDEMTLINLLVYWSAQLKLHPLLTAANQWARLLSASILNEFITWAERNSETSKCLFSLETTNKHTLNANSA